MKSTFSSLLPLLAILRKSAQYYQISLHYYSSVGFLTHCPSTKTCGICLNFFRNATLTFTGWIPNISRCLGRKKRFVQNWFELYANMSSPFKMHEARIFYWFYTRSFFEKVEWLFSSRHFLVTNHKIPFYNKRSCQGGIKHLITVFLVVIFKLQMEK